MILESDPYGTRGARASSSEQKRCGSRLQRAAGGSGREGSRRKRKRAPARSGGPIRCPGGDEGNRTLGLCHATAALSQLSYVPKTRIHSSNRGPSVNGKIAAKENRPPLHLYEPTYSRWAPSSSLPASLTTKDTCSGDECVGSLNKRDGSPSCSAGGGIPIYYGAPLAIPVLT